MRGAYQRRDVFYLFWNKQQPVNIIFFSNEMNTRWVFFPAVWIYLSILVVKKYPVSEMYS